MRQWYESGRFDSQTGPDTQYLPRVSEAHQTVGEAEGSLRQYHR